MRKKAFVTGGSRGIGRGIAIVLAKEGYDIAFTYNSRLDEAESLSHIIENLGGKAYYYQASMEKDGVPETITETAVKDLGGIDVLVCNAGVTRHDSILKLTEDHIDFLYKLNFRSYMMCAKVAANHMVKEQVEGSIIFISSTRGISAHPEDNIYGSFKAGLIRSVQSVALELSEYGININVVAPGATAIRGDYSMEQLSKGWAKKIPMKRLGTPEEVGHLVKYLVSDVAEYITGETIRIDGGLILPGMKEVE
ncbi:SDR family NAD(P)-dependent oxidoreductase [Vallitalea okinawensis]|uniref:SDR family NAD(P)-dependent oxidoreductase n=1 Tax=Vallitalea okinawensis TaxID=2078660 RepID=UPI001FA8C389|nr:SDR family oxidoreductase [Vallitalea okinawensis]